MLARALVACVLVSAVALAGSAPSAGDVDQLTVRVHPTVVPWGELVTVSGTIVEQKANESVDIHVKDCGQTFFRGRIGTHTNADGSWTTGFYPGINTTLRVIWDGHRSEEFTVHQVAGVYLTPVSGRVFRVSAIGVGGTSAPFWRKRTLIQIRRSGAWKTLREVRLTENTVRGTPVRIAVPRGSVLRAVLPRSQARPCYLAGVSRTVRA
jgi:hypothetical protein